MERAEKYSYISYNHHTPATLASVLIFMAAKQAYSNEKYHC